MEISFENGLSLNQDEFYPNIPAGTPVLTGGISFGACVAGIGSNEDGSYCAGHFSPGTIVSELTAIAKMCSGKVSVHQSEREGMIEDLYVSGTIMSVDQVKRSFKDRDRPYVR